MSTDAPESPDTPRLLHALQTGLKDNVVVVVGGSGGVGSCVCRQAAALGARVISASRSGAAVERASMPEPGAIASVYVDIANPASIRAFSLWLELACGRVDILVLSAGITRTVPAGDLHNLDDALIDAVFTTNAGGVLRCIRDLAPLLKKGKDPAIVNVSSVAARTGVGSNIAYVGAKAAMDAMCVSLAKALAPAVRVLSVAPSALDTDFAKGRGADFIERTVRATPLARLATTDEVADAALVAARLLPMTTGVTIFVDGGRHL